MATSEIKLGYDERDRLFKKEYIELKIKVVLNWFELSVLFLVSFIVSFELFSKYVLKDIFFTVILSLVVGVLISWIFCCFRNYQFKISRFDKEDIYKRISTELIKQSKKNQFSK
ncbi:MAG: hypothetical protein COX70_01155 [Flavobacteriales bacterium CG_4_10_14_0_2_um_filter_32_8]|nr:MAG: hypothetical protein COX70_01155 [Flavobacteriales bacterium CG_4_10_14_0_2_um_filter_32_8]PJB14670.1 MAG: hypothetical protein CO118_07450 [Flavobacteriales bacterium CG_4_9_14_3_um_filter_32_8]